MQKTPNIPRTLNKKQSLLICLLATTMARWRASLGVFLVFFMSSEMAMASAPLPAQSTERGIQSEQLVDRIALREEVRGMLHHALSGYMTHAFPADELKPLSCAPRDRQKEQRGHLDDALGNFSLTLLDGLDTLAVAGEWRSFARAVHLSLGHSQEFFSGVQFGSDVRVNVFEVTIRALGGLLGAHQLARVAVSERERAFDAAAAGGGEEPFPSARSQSRPAQRKGAHRVGSPERVLGPAADAAEAQATDGGRWLWGARVLLDEARQPGLRKNLSRAEIDDMLTREDVDGLLDLAVVLGDRLLRAFDTPTGIPYSIINLRYGPSSAPNQVSPIEETCTAGAGTLLMEMGMLSRLSGDPRYEAAARRAIGALWMRRGPLGLYGTSIRVDNGAWTRGVSSIGAGADSFFEYLLKSSILLDSRPAVTGEWARRVTFNEGNGVSLTTTQSLNRPPSNRGENCPSSSSDGSSSDGSCESESGARPDLMGMFETSYASVERHHNRDGWYFDVSMQNAAMSRDWVDSLQAFWPAMQVLHGDVRKAAAMHAKLWDVWKHWGLLPEAFSPHSHLQNRPKYAVVQPGYPLRPEVAESTLALYQATKDPMYLAHGRDMVRALQSYCRTSCGFAGLSHVYGYKDESGGAKTLDEHGAYMDGNGGRVLPGGRRQEDRFDSYFIAETLKYLFLLFDTEHDIHKQSWILTTEGHPMHIGLAHERAPVMLPHAASLPVLYTHPPTKRRPPTCPAEPRRAFHALLADETRAALLAQGLSKSCVPTSAPIAIKPKVIQGSSTLKDWVISTPAVGRGQDEDPRRRPACDVAPSVALTVVEISSTSSGSGRTQRRQLGPMWGNPANFGQPFPASPLRVGPAVLAMANPPSACSTISVTALEGFVCVVDRGDCTFAKKATKCAEAGASAMVLLDRADSDLVTMNGIDILPHEFAVHGIPAVRVRYEDAVPIRSWLAHNHKDAARSVSVTASLSASFEYDPRALTPGLESSLVDEPQGGVVVQVSGVGSDITPEQLLAWVRSEMGLKPGSEGLMRDGVVVSEVRHSGGKTNPIAVKAPPPIQPPLSEFLSAIWRDAQMSRQQQPPAVGSRANVFCLLFSAGWWTYEVCPFHDVRQFRLAGNQRTDLQLLGQAEGRELTVEVDTKHARFVAEDFQRGSQCLPHRAERNRSAKVRYMCGSVLQVVAIREPFLCTYEIDVSVPKLCGHPALRSSPP
jgi:Glycosyl hydrolase family 47/PA domain/Glucosidase II beta subunit-like protein